ncbi:hypothetical protein WBG78_21565 [Chryseolinea sp. T2]|uniref:hypothetical protein n=1 Tax=Chryseolinea sp. T2 TaxID=3129255 RepID=UPI003076F3FD
METSDREQQNGVVDAVGDLIETYRCFVNVRIVESAARGGSVSIFGILILVVGVFVLLFAGLGTAWWIGDAMHNMKAGFFIVGGFYLFLLLIGLLTANSTILPWLRNIIVRNIYEQV